MSYINLKFLIFFAFIFTNPLSIKCQEHKLKKTKNQGYLEEYYVLKEDKSIKDGQYLKFKLGEFDEKILVEFGKYDKNKKTGTWYIFFNNGSLKAYGEFENNYKSGLWNSYYRNNSNSFENILSSQSEFVKIENGSLKFDESKLKRSSSGFIDGGIKSGTWAYYNRDSKMSQMFNHNNDSILGERLDTNINCPFFGGFDRFTSCFDDAKNEHFSKGKTAFDHKQYVYKIGFENSDVKISNVSDAKSQLVEDGTLELIMSIDNDWSSKLLRNNVNHVFLEILLGEKEGLGTIEFSFKETTSKFTN